MIGSSVILNAPEGEQYNTYTNQRWPLGTLMMLQDGRKFRFFENGATALAAGRLIQSEVPGANFDELAIPSAVAVNTKAFNVTNGATAITLNQFAEGYMNVEDDAGEGHLYKIAGNAAEAAGSAPFEVQLAHGILVAFTTATTVGLTKSPYRDAIIHPSPPTAAVLGVTPVAVAANAFGWVQTWGPCSVLTEGTLVIGDSVQASSSADGAVTPFTLTEGTPNVEITPVVGWCMELAATTEHSLVFLTIE